MLENQEADELIILDFETTGLSPNFARIIEVGAVLVKGNKVIDQITQLLHPGSSIPFFISELTGITNQMLKGKPTPESFMPTLHSFIGKRPILAHNALFDQKFLISEMHRIGIEICNPFLCTLKLARRLIHDVPNYKLTTLTEHLKFKTHKAHKAHRALDDVLVTVDLWLHMHNIVSKYINTHPELNIFFHLENLAKHKIKTFLKTQMTN
jgi:DNA polymerase-3 subunit epsilon